MTLDLENNKNQKKLKEKKKMIEEDCFEELEKLEKKLIQLNNVDLLGDTICKEKLSVEDRVVGSLLLGMMGKKKKLKIKIYLYLFFFLFS
jgi:hypothetical protein